MAVATAAWTDYAVLDASKAEADGTRKQYRVQFRAEGIGLDHWRCGCPDWIFGYKRRGVPLSERDCKHAQWARADRQARLSSLSLKDRTAPALEIVNEMLRAGSVRYLDEPTKARMAAILSAHMTTWQATAEPEFVAPALPDGIVSVRMISFGDD